MGVGFIGVRSGPLYSDNKANLSFIQTKLDLSTGTDPGKNTLSFPFWAPFCPSLLPITPNLWHI